MKINKIYVLFIFIFLYSCAGYEKNKSAEDYKKIYYSSSGFALIYEDFLYENKTISKKINNEHILILHSTLKNNTPVRITNLKNYKSLETKVFKKANYPKLFNVVLTKKIASILDLDIENPFVEIIQIKKNKKFIAKEGNIFEEEKIVANTAPVDEIAMDDLTVSEIKENKKVSKKEKFMIVVSDFYYKDSAVSLKNDLSKKIFLSNIFIKKINNKKYRLLIGPFKNFNALKTTYISLNNLGFESLNIYNE
jgi:hypothetical protein